MTTIDIFDEQQIRVLEKICTFNNEYFLGNDPLLIDRELRLCSRELEEQMKVLQSKGLLKMTGGGDVPEYDGRKDETYSTGDFYISYKVLDKEKLINLLNELKIKYPKRKTPILKTKVVEAISKKIGDILSNEEWIKFFNDNGFNSDLLYFNKNWEMVRDVFEYLAISAKQEDIDLLFKLIEDISHPLMLGGDGKRTEELQNSISSCLEYDGFCMQNGKIMPISSAQTDDGIKINSENSLASVAVAEAFKKPMTAIPLNEKTPKNIELKSAAYPKVISNGEHCFLQLSKTQKLKIGKNETRKALLAKSLGENFGLSKAVNTVFNEIRLPKDENNPSFENPTTAHTNKLNVIKMTAREINRTLKIGRDKKIHLKANEGYVKTVKFEWW